MGQPLILTSQNASFLGGTHGADWLIVAQTSTSMTWKAVHIARMGSKPAVDTLKNTRHLTMMDRALLQSQFVVELGGGQIITAWIAERAHLRTAFE